MKKLLVLTALILFSGIVFSQTLEKGNLIGVHVGKVILDPDVTLNQWKDFYLNKYSPAVGKGFQGDLKLFLGLADRGDDENMISIFWVFKSIEARDKYFTQEGEATELLISEWEKLQPIREEANKLGTWNRKHYTDWVIQ